ncbi:MAG: hypothetical protein IID46_08845, partial [Planctomycetes bacterium]|nr:hypothetical protein [Planctomycetota bacterium]
MFRRRLTDEEYVETNRKTLVWLKKWGRWPISAFTFLLAAACIGCAVLLVNLGFQFFAFPQQGQNQGLRLGFAVGGVLGLVAGWILMQGFDLFKKGLELFVEGHRSIQLMVTYHDTLNFIMDKENFVLHDFA